MCGKNYLSMLPGGFEESNSICCFGSFLDHLAPCCRSVMFVLQGKIRLASRGKKYFMHRNTKASRLQEYVKLAIFFILE